MPEPESFAVAVSATVPRTFVPGLVMVTLGDVLSTSRLETSAVWVFPAASVTKTRRSYSPSATPAVSNETVYGAEVSVPIVDHVPAPAGLPWNVTEPAPDLAAVAVAFSAIVPPRFAPGSAIETDGAVRSTVTFRTAVVVRPAASV